MALKQFKIYSLQLSKNVIVGIVFLLLFFSSYSNLYGQTYNSTNCSNVPFSFNEPGSAATETYSWTVYNTTGSVSGQTNSSGTAINQTLINNSNTVATVSYHVVTNSPSSTFDLVATVNPSSLITNLGTLPTSICSGNNLLFTASTDISGATVSWTRNPIAGISPVSGAGASPLSETLTNNTTDPITVTYNFSTNASGCMNTQTATLIVNPLPVLSNSAPVAICSGTNFSFNPSSLTSGTTYTWTRNLQTSISNAAGSGTGAISEVLTNTSTLPVAVIYNYSLIANGCPNLQTLTELVNPTPDVPNPPTVTICNGNIFNVSPAGVPVGTTYTWTMPTYNPIVSINGGSAVIGSPQASISQTLNNNTASPATATYTVTPLSGQCIGNPFSVNVIVTNTPVLTVSTTNPICTNTAFVYSPGSLNANSTFDWTRASVSGITNSSNSGTGQINELLNNNTNATVTVAYIYTLKTPIGCTNFQTITVDVNPNITLNSPAPTSICSGINFNYIPTSATNNVSYSWTRSVVNGISNTAGSGTGNINEALINTTNAPIIVSYTYTLSAGGCSANQTISVTVNPGPVLSNQNIAICNNSAFTVNTNGAPVGTQYTWSTPILTPGASISGSSSSNGTQTGISQVLSNNTTSPAIATYTITPLSATCTGPNFTVVVTVNNTPILSSVISNAAICSYSAFIYNPTTTEPGLSTYNWVRASIPGISNAASTGTGAINETLINTSNALITVSYAYTIKTAAGCSNNEIITVGVKPSLALTSGNPAAICSNNTFIYNPTSASAGASFTWSRQAVGGISNPAVSNIAGQINEALLNTTNTFITVPYTYTISAGGCSNPQTINLVVNPVPNVASQSISICNSSAFSINTTGVPIGTKYTWTNPVLFPSGSITGGSANAVAQNVFTQTLTNTTASTATATYTVTPIAGTCAGSAFTAIFTVNVNAASSLTSTLTPNPICSSNSFDYFPSSGTPGTSFAWSRTALLGVSNPAATGNGVISETLINTSANPITVTYIISLTSGIGCVGTQNVNVVLNPTPTLSNATQASICSGANLNYIPTSATAGSTFSWTRASVAGISNPASSGINSPGESLINTTASIVPVTYNYTINANGCANNQSFDVAVNPAPVLNSGIAPTICSGTNFSFSASSLTTGTTYVWNRPIQNNISNAAITSPSNTISEILVNTSTLPVTVRYDFVLTANGCSNNQQVFGIVNPTPVIADQITTICSGNSFSITPTKVPANTNYTWQLPTISPALSIGGASAGTAQNSISNTLINSTNSLATATYNITPTANACVGAVFTATITVTNTPRLSSGLNPAAICNNSVFNYTPSSTSGNLVFGWTRAAVVGISNPGSNGNGNPNEILTNTGITPITVNYQYQLSTVGGCSNTETVAVVVNPKATLTSANPNPICSGNIFNYTALSNIAGATFTWSRAVVPSISNLANNGIGDPSEILLNTSNNPISVAYVYAVSAYGCSNTQNINVLVNPTANVSNQIATICNNSSFSITPTNVPAGTTYTWSSPVYNPVTAIAGGSAVGTPQNVISQTLVNTNLNPATATYTITPNSNGCMGANFTATITVSNTVILNSSLAPSPICSNTAFSYIPSSNTAATNFGWTRLAVVGISNPIASGIGNPNETLINTTGNAITVSYQYALNTFAGCTNSQTVSVLVKPSPVLISNLNPAAICSGTNFVYTPVSNVSGSLFSWTRATVPNISNAPANGFLSPNEFLVNTGITSVTVPYIYTTSINGCSNTQTVNATINPVANISNQTNTICGNTAFLITPSNVPIGTKYTWQLPSALPVGSISGISAQNVLQSSISQLLLNQTLNSATATYTVTPNSSGCIGNSFLIDITVKPTAIIANQTIAAVCSGSAFSYQAINVPIGTFYTWANPIIGPSGSLIGGSAQPLSQVAVSQILSSSNNLIDTAYYTVSPSSAGCAGSDFVLTVPIKPVPFVNNLFDTVCTGTAFSVFPQPVPANTTYTWTTPTSIPFGIVTGGSANNIPVNIISQIPINSGTSAAKLLYTITPSANGCIGNSFSLLETVGVQLNQIANIVTSICSGTGFDVTPVTLPVNTKYTWTIQSITPAGMISGTSTKTTPQTKVTNDTLINLSAVTASAVYAVTPSNTGCNGPIFLATINVRAVPKATISGNATICAYVNDTLTVTFAGTGPWNFNYLDNGVPKTQTGITTNPYSWIVPTPLLASTKSLAITYVTDMACIDSVDTSRFVQKVNPLPIGNVVSMHGKYICNNTADTLFVNHTMDTLSYQWTFNGAKLPGINSDSISTLSPGRYNAYFTNGYGCTDTSAVPVTLTYIVQPTINFSYDSYCINNLINFKNLTDTTYTGPTSWLWDLGDSTTRNRFDAANTYATAGKRTIKLTAFQFYCPANTTTLDSVINIEFPIGGLHMPSVSAYLGQYTPIAARSIPTYKYLWTPSWGIDHPDSSSINFNYQHTQEYIINLKAPSGCISFDTVLVRVFDDKLVDILVPKSFTPNGDGVNDKLYPYLTGVKTFQYFKVFNRFGKLMYESRNPDEGWDGTVGGTQQPMAIYIWVAMGIGLDGSPVERKGETLLLR